MLFGGVLAGTKDKTPTMPAVLANCLTSNGNTKLCSVRNVLPCWHRKKLSLGKVLGLGEDCVTEPMATFTFARFVGGTARGGFAGLRASGVAFEMIR